MIVSVQNPLAREHPNPCGVVRNITSSTLVKDFEAIKKVIENVIVLDSIENTSLRSNTIRFPSKRLSIPESLYKLSFFANCIPVAEGSFKGSDFLRRFEIGHLIENS